MGLYIRNLGVTLPPPKPNLKNFRNIFKSQKCTFAVSGWFSQTNRFKIYKNVLTHLSDPALSSGFIFDSSRTEYWAQQLSRRPQISNYSPTYFTVFNK